MTRRLRVIINLAEKWWCKYTTRSLIVAAFLRSASFPSQFLSFQEELLVCQASSDWSPLCRCRGTYKGGKEACPHTCPQAHMHMETFSAAPTPRPVVCSALLLCSGTFCSALRNCETVLLLLPCFRPHICHFFSTNVLFGLNFSPHESA